MSPPLYAALVFVHLAGIIVWLGGMVFAHFALRPAAMQLLQPPERLPLMAHALGKFFRLVAVAILAILVSGTILFSRIGIAQAPLGWHVMLAIGLVMTAIFIFIYGRLYPALCKSVSARDWSAAAASLNGVRRWVLVNICLGFVAVAAAALARV